MPRVYARRPRSRSRVDRVTLIVLAAFLVIASITAVLAFVWVRSRFVPAGPASPVVAGGKSSTGLTGGSTGDENIPVPTGPLQRVTDPTPVPWDGVSRVTILVMGLDYRDWSEGDDVPRTDSMILFSIDPVTKTAGMLSIPRDLWVTIPGVGENRINTAHFFAEAQNPGSGPISAAQTVEQNFGLRVPYYVRLRFDAFLGIVDALGGVTVDLPADMGGLTAGRHHLDGAQALAFVRDRQGTDDFFRMERGQLMLKAVAKETLLPTAWPRIPAVIQAGFSSVDSNIPFWQWPRLGLAILRAGLTDSIDSSTIRREMTTPYITDEGANVLLPDWNQIHPFVDEMFAQ